MFVLAVGEVSNIFMVPWHAARFCEYSTLHRLLSPLVTVSFTIMRVVVAPLYAYIFFREALTTNHKVPGYLVYMYMTSYVLLLLGSWFWVYKLLKGYFKMHGATPNSRKAE